MSEKKTAFKIDQKVVYPSQGVGKIIEVFEKDLKGKKVQYYKIYLDVSDMIVMVPVDRAVELGIRAIVSAAEAQKALDLLGQEGEPITSDWKARYQMNLDLLKKGSIQDIATIVRCLYRRSKIKELPILERKLYDSAKKLLEDEISFAMGKTSKEVEAMLHAKLEPLGGVKEPRHAVDNDDDDDDDDFMGDVKSSDKDSDSEDGEEEDEEDGDDADESADTSSDSSDADEDDSDEEDEEEDDAGGESDDL